MAPPEILMLSNYGERFRSGERISSCLAESTVNAVISKRFAKRQQMQWTIKTIVEAIEAMAPDLVVKLEEANRQAKIRHQEWLAAEERRNREEDRRRVEKSIADSETELRQIIEQWSNVMGIERFLSGVEQKASSLPEIDRLHVLDRLALARSFLGKQDPLDFFRSWKTPEERYTSRYQNNERETEDLDAMTDHRQEE
jgi:hypothetical protein